MTDSQLLQEYAQSRSQEAFAQLVTRHADWVYSLAVRRLQGDAHLAEDVTQAVFLLLSQKAAVIGHGSPAVLNARLFKTAQYASANASRMKIRREKHERQAAMVDESRESEVNQLWDQMAPNLDELVERLRPQDRDALL